MKERGRDSLKAPSRRNSRYGRAVHVAVDLTGDLGKGIPTSPSHRTHKAEFLCLVSLCTRLFLSFLCVSKKKISLDGWEQRSAANTGTTPRE